MFGRIRVEMPQSVTAWILGQGNRQGKVGFLFLDGRGGGRHWPGKLDGLVSQEDVHRDLCSYSSRVPTPTGSLLTTESLSSQTLSSLASESVEDQKKTF